RAISLLSLHDALPILMAASPFIQAARFGKRVALDHGAVDVSIVSFVTLDITLLLFLVCQEGGLCRSVFLPVYFLIPLAYMSVERDRKSTRLNSSHEWI